MKCCICGQDLAGQPAMVDNATGDAFCSQDSQYFGLHPGNRPRRAPSEQPRSLDVAASTTSRYFPGTAARRQGLAVTSLVIGIISILTLGLLFVGPISGLILGIVALKKANRTPSQFGGTGLAIGGIVTNAVALVIAPIGLAALIIPFVYVTKRPQSLPAIALAPPFEKTTMTTLTNTGNCKSAAISPDGKYVVYTEVDGLRQSMWIRQVESGSNFQIVTPAEVNFLDLSFSPAGNFIYYTMIEKNAPAFSLYQLPVVGGSARKVFTNISGEFGLSPDGAQVALVREDPSTGENALVAVNMDGTNERKLVTYKKPSFYRNPSWSPDGRNLVTIEGLAERSGASQLVEVRVGDGTIQPLKSERWFDMEAVAWSRNSDDLIVIAQYDASSSHQVWRVTRRSGESHKITNDSNDYRGLSLTLDSSALVTIRVHQSGSPTGDVVLIRKST
jgi:hypothetical protein